MKAAQSSTIWSINSNICLIRNIAFCFFCSLDYTLVSFSASYYYVRLKHIQCKCLLTVLNTCSAELFTYIGKLCSSCSLLYPWWSLQNPSFAHASGSPQSQHPPTFLFNHTLCPLWFPFSKHSWQIMHVGSFSHVSHFHATSPYERVFAQTPFPELTLWSSSIALSWSI